MSTTAEGTSMVLFERPVGTTADLEGDGVSLGEACVNG